MVEYATLEAARDFGINLNLLRRWERECEGDSGEIGNMGPHQAELKNLQGKIKRLKIEPKYKKKQPPSSRKNWLEASKGTYRTRRIAEKRPLEAPKVATKPVNPPLNRTN